MNVSDLPASPVGVHTISEAEYHADTVALSSSGARRLLPPSCPAKFRHEQLHGRPPKAAFDFGHAAHSLILGVGQPLVIVDAKNWTTKAAKEQRDEAYAAGHVPILVSEHEQVVAMAAAIREHPTAAALLDPSTGAPEQSLYWTDERTGVPLRARLDWLPHVTERRMVIPDYKTTISADPESIAKSVWTYGYYAQAAFYIDAVHALGLDDDPAFVLICQEKTAPYLVAVVEPDAQALAVGRARNRQAIDIYADCTATDTWPGYSEAVELVSLPRWAATDLDMEMTA